MNFKRTIIINRPIKQVWDVLGNQFGQAHAWASSVNHAETYGAPTLEGASCSNRSCNTTAGNVKEVIRTFDPEGRVLAYEVLEGFPFFVAKGHNTWRLSAKGKNTRVDMDIEILTKGVFGAIMSPMMKLQMNKLADEAVDDLKYYVEHDGTPHPRKVKAAQKFAKKAA